MMGKTQGKIRRISFEKNILPLISLEAEIDVMIRPNGSYTFEVPGFGIVDHFPNSGKLLIRRENQWIENGVRWIKQNVLPF